MPGSFGGAGEIIENYRAVERGASGRTPVGPRRGGRHDGTMGADLNPKFRELVGNIIAYENITVLLPMSLFSTWPIR